MRVLALRVIPRQADDLVDQDDLADSIEELERFLREVVVEGKDPKAEERRRCVQRYIVPPNNRSAAQNIIDAILG